MKNNASYTDGKKQMLEEMFKVPSDSELHEYQKHLITMVLEDTQFTESSKQKFAEWVESDVRKVVIKTVQQGLFTIYEVRPVGVETDVYFSYASKYTAMEFCRLYGFSIDINSLDA